MSKVSVFFPLRSSTFRMGYDGLFFGRLDYADKERRRRDRRLELVWRGDAGDKTGQADLFTGALFNAYR